MQLTDVLEEFIFDCKLRRMSERTIKGYKNNNLRFITFIRNEYQVSELEKVHCKLIKAYLEQLSSRKNAKLHQWNYKKYEGVLSVLYR